MFQNTLASTLLSCPHVPCSSSPIIFSIQSILVYIQLISRQYCFLSICLYLKFHPDTHTRGAIIIDYQKFFFVFCMEEDGAHCGVLWYVIEWQLRSVETWGQVFKKVKLTDVCTNCYKCMDCYANLTDLLENLSNGSKLLLLYKDLSQNAEQCFFLFYPPSLLFL